MPTRGVYPGNICPLEVFIQTTIFSLEVFVQTTMNRCLACIFFLELPLFYFFSNFLVVTTMFSGLSHHIYKNVDCLFLIQITKSISDTSNRFSINYAVTAILSKNVVTGSTSKCEMLCMYLVSW